MVLPNPLQQLRDLDKSSPQFQEQLRGLFRGEEYQGLVPNLQGEDLVWFVEYLDGVSLQTIYPYSVLTTSIGSDQYFRSRESRIPGILVRAWKDMWR